MLRGWGKIWLVLSEGGQTKQDTSGYCGSPHGKFFSLARSAGLELGCVDYGAGSFPETGACARGAHYAALGRGLTFASASGFVASRRS